MNNNNNKNPDLESARKETWERPDEDGKILVPGRPTSIGQLLGKAKWEKPLTDRIVATGVGLLYWIYIDRM
jgi:hypothetical protein